MGEEKGAKGEGGPPGIFLFSICSSTKTKSEHGDFKLSHAFFLFSVGHSDHFFAHGSRKNPGFRTTMNYARPATLAAEAEGEAQVVSVVRFES